MTAAAGLVLAVKTNEGHRRQRASNHVTRCPPSVSTAQVKQRAIQGALLDGRSRAGRRAGSVMIDDHQAPLTLRNAFPLAIVCACCAARLAVAWLAVRMSRTCSSLVPA
jgi:predicted alpha/beta-hydrolase family hydrolase